jgi:hypothetical protein
MKQVAKTETQTSHQVENQSKPVLANSLPPIPLDTGDSAKQMPAAAAPPSQQQVSNSGDSMAPQKQQNRTDAMPEGIEVHLLQERIFVGNDASDKHFMCRNHKEEVLLLVRGLNSDKTFCSHIFNLFSVYGNISTVSWETTRDYLIMNSK